MRASSQLTKRVLRCRKGTRNRLHKEPYACARSSPSSRSSRTVYCDKPTYISRSSTATRSPLCNLKIEIVNRAVVSKVQPDNHTHDKLCEDPPQERPGQQHLSLDKCANVKRSRDLVPDRGVDPPRSVVPLEVKVSNRQRGDCEGLGNTRDAGGSSSTPRFEMGSVGGSSGSTGAGSVRFEAQGLSPLHLPFNLDVEDVLCLSPISDGEGSGGDIDEFIESCCTFYENSLHMAKDAVPAPSASCSDVHQDDRKGSWAQDTGAGQDEGYFSKTHQEVLSQGMDSFQAGCFVPTCTSSPVKKSPLSNRGLILGVGEVQPSSTHSEVSDSAGKAKEPSTGVVLPLLAKAKEVKSADKGRSLGMCKSAPVPTVQCQGQATSAVVDSRVQKSRDSSLPRPTVFKSEADWQQEKQRYLDAVSSHMADSPNQTGAVMSELHDLMSAVAHQGADSSKVSWQHPSDLTRRNYRSAQGPMVSLDQWWQQQNSQFHQRFASVPLRFQRSRIY